MHVSVKQLNDFLLVEDFSDGLSFEGKTIVALNPKACFDLDRKGFSYKIIEDYFDESQLIKEAGDYHKSQLEWFNEFDNLIFEIFPEAKEKGLRLATVYYYWLKGMIDPVITRSKAISSFIEKARPNSLTYVSVQWESDNLEKAKLLFLFRGGQSLFSRLFEKFAEKHQISFKRVIINNTRKCSIKSRFNSVIKNNSVIYKYIKEVQFNLKTFRYSAFTLRKERLKILFLKFENYGLPKIISECYRKGSLVYLKNNYFLFRKGIFFNRRMKIPVIPEIFTLNSVENSKKLGKVIDWISKKCGVDVSSIVSPRFNYFLDFICPQFLRLLYGYINLYDKEKLDFVFTPYMVDVADFAVVSAAEFSARTKSICLHHGNGVFALKMWDYGEYCPYHFYLTETPEMEAYIKGRISAGNFKTRALTYQNNYKSPLALKKTQRSSKELPRKSILYAPIMYHGDCKPWNETRIPDNLYFKWQSQLLDLFESFKQYDFVWKAIPASNELYDPIPDILRLKNPSNIKYASDSLVSWFSRVDLILLDYPSTAFYEAADSGKPVVCFYFAPFNIVRSTAEKIFGKSLQSAESFSEGLEMIREVIKGEWGGYSVKLPKGNKPIIEILQSASKG